MCTPTLTCAFAAWNVKANTNAAIANFKVFMILYMNNFNIVVHVFKTIDMPVGLMFRSIILNIASLLAVMLRFTAI